MRDPTPAELVVELVRTLDEALTDYAPWAEGGGVRLMPSTYTCGSYSELERRMGEMRDSAWRQAWWHLNQRYRWGETKRLVVRTRKTAKGRVPILPPRSEVLISGEVIAGGLQVVHAYTWSEAVDHLLVSRGVLRLVETMHEGDTSKLTLPVPFLHRMLGIEKEARSVQPIEGHLQSRALPAA